MKSSNLLLRLAALTILLAAASGLRAQTDPYDIWTQFIEAYSNWDIDVADIRYYTDAHEMTVLAKAAPDECFFGIGDDRNNFVWGGIDCQDCRTAGGTPKVNQAYVWGLTKSGDDVWFGTGPNIHCLVIDSFLAALDAGPVQTSSYACEFEANDPLRDTRPPRIFLYNMATKTLTDKTFSVSGPMVPGPGGTQVNLGQSRLAGTLGIRSAGSSSSQGVVILAGPGFTITRQQCVNFFAFDTATGNYLNTYQNTGWVNIRKWVEHNGHLYTGVKRSAASGGGGAVLRWTGTLANPFTFEVVAILPSEPAELAVHEDRLFVSTWPDSTVGELGVASLIMSPLFGADGLLSVDDQQGWQTVWTAADYEPDPIAAATYGGGALASYDGWLYWGTMHVPGTGLVAFQEYYRLSECGSSSVVNPEDPPPPVGPPPPSVCPDAEEYLQIFLNTYRSISIFRGRNFGNYADSPRVAAQPGQKAAPIVNAAIGPSAEIELLYGYPAMPVYVPGETGGYEGGFWTTEPNRLGAPLFGLPGFGNLLNNYTWTMSTMGGRLYVGTMDWSYLIYDLADQLDFIEALPPELTEAANLTLGADLWAFDSASDYPGAIPVNLGGADNHSSYGIRTMLAGDDYILLGMANPMNLLTDTTDDRPEGGWELVKMERLRRIYVDDTAPAAMEEGPEDGMSWYTAFTNLDKALLEAQNQTGFGGTQIFVANGLYSPTLVEKFSRTGTFAITDGISLVGGFLGWSEYTGEFSPRVWRELPTVLDGTRMGNFHVVSATGLSKKSVIDGFYINGGRATGSGSRVYGGALYVSNASNLTIKNLELWNNTSLSFGGAIHIGSSNVTLSNITAHDNSSNNSGGALSIFSSTVHGNRLNFSNNSAKTAGGAIYLKNSTVNFTNALLHHNTAIRTGGAVHAVSSTFNLNQGTVADNSVPSYGQGGGCYFDSASVGTMQNSIFWGNSASRGSQMLSLRTSNLTVTNNDIQGGWSTGTDIQNADPMFMDTTDYYLDPASPAAFGGNANSLIRDLDNLPRFNNSLGARGVFFEIEPPPMGTPQGG